MGILDELEDEFQLMEDLVETRRNPWANKPAYMNQRYFCRTCGIEFHWKESNRHEFCSEICAAEDENAHNNAKNLTRSNRVYGGKAPRKRFEDDFNF